MSSLNNVQLIGNLGRDPEIRHTNSGDPVAQLSVATSEKWTDRNSGEKREKTEWHRVVVFGKLAGICEQYLRKGSKVYLSGKLTTRKWQDQNGQDRYTTEVVLSGFNGQMIMLDSRGQGGGPVSNDYSSQPEPGGGYGGAPAPSGQPASEADFDDEIPF